MQPDLGYFFKAKPKKTIRNSKTAGSTHHGGIDDEIMSSQTAELRPGFIHNCCASGNLNLLRAAITAGNDVDERDNKGRTPLMNASLRGDLRITAALLEGNADVNANTTSGLTALTLAVMSGSSLRAVPQLLQAKASVDAATAHGLTALMEAAKQGKPAAAMALLAARANPNLVHESSWTALLLAADHGSVDVVDALLQSRANVNETNNEGVTPLIAATEKYHSDVVHLLISEGATPETRDIDGDSAFEIASRSGNRSVVAELDRVISRIVVNLVFGERAEEQEMSISCLGISGNELASFLVPLESSVGQLREELAQILKVHPTRIRLLCGVSLLEQETQKLNEILADRYLE